MRYATKFNLCLGAVGAALWAGVFLLPAYPRAMPLSAFEAVADAKKSPRPATPDEVPPLRRKQGTYSGVDRERESNCLAVNLLSRAHGEATGRSDHGRLGHPEWIGASEIFKAPV